MTKERKVPVMPAESYPLGHAKENKDEPIEKLPVDKQVKDWYLFYYYAQ